VTTATAESAGVSGALGAASRFRGKRATVMGLGRFSGGVGVARYLAERGAAVTVTDIAGADTLGESMAALAGLPITYHLGGHDEADFTSADLVVVGPGVPKGSPFLAAAKRAGVPLSAEMNLFLAECRGRVVGITGTNGKSTTTAMVAAVLSARHKTWLGGNIGRSLLADVDRIGPDDRVALEMSSFQLEDLAPDRLSPPVAVVTNLTPNHLDRHGSMDEYGEAKKNIFRFQRPGDWVILNADDPITREWHADRRGRLAWFTTGSTPPTGGDMSIRWNAGAVEAEFDDGVDCEAGVRRAAGMMKLRVPGRHNVANAMAALAVAGIEGLPLAESLAALEGYRSLPDRLEFVAEVNGVEWYNDSIATTPESVFAALDSFDRPRIVIAGGHNKNLDLAPLAGQLAEKAKAVVLIGNAADEIEGLLRKAVEARRAAGKTGEPVVARAGRSMEAAVRVCAELARPGDVVLMSPACASFDMFTNYRHRGEVFRKAVEALSAPAAAAAR
jgi:UDP-N-acetylmuramoylalanine--D-glutamate ligase